MRKCEQCIYYPKCDEYPFDESGCKDFKDKSRFVELPCKPGDMVYVIDEKHPCFACWCCTDHCHLDCRISDRRKLVVKTAVVSSISYKQRCNEIEVDTVSHNTNVLHNYEQTYAFNDFGKTVFLTKEEAERHLLEGKDDT